MYTLQRHNMRFRKTTIVKVRNRRLLLLLLFILLTHVVFANKVYVVLSSDTSIWYNTSGGSVGNTYENEFDFDVFANPEGVYKQVFDETFRNTHTDSIGTPFKVTWFMHGGGWFLRGTNTTSISTTYLIKKYWLSELERWGDELAYHFHHFKWDGTKWTIADTFGETIWDFEWTMSQMIIDESLYPVCFRSGWNYMDNEYQQYLEKWIPFRMEGGSWMPDCTPYHPSYTDYRQPGDMKGWEVRHIYMKSFSQDFANSIFNVAHSGKEQVVCIWSHQNESDFIQQIADVDQRLHEAAAMYPDVQFFYCSGKEAMQKWLKTSDTTPPALDLSTQRDGDTISVLITTEPDIYQVQPWVAARKYSGEYVRLDTEPISTGVWRFSYSTSEVDRVVVGVSDVYGNVRLAEVQDGSRRWTTQSELYYSRPVNLDIESLVNRAVLDKSTSPCVVIDQSSHNNQTNPLLRSYWIGQTFVPRSTGISRVVFGATVIQPAVYRVELRSTLASGFPDDNPSGLLAFATASIDSSGTTSVWLNYNGLQLDGRTYVLVFKLVSGDAEIWLNTQDVYPDGMVIRAYSLDWITIPDFDCLFQIFDESGGLSINQPFYNGDAYPSERGYFVAQTFLAKTGNITGIEINVTAPDIGIIVDNDDGPPAYVEGGTAEWHTSASPGYNNLTYRYSTGGADATATWTANLPESGDYNVYAIFRQSTNRVTSARYDIHASDGTYTVYINQNGENTMVERHLGLFHFNAGNNSVTLDAKNSSPAGDAVIADAIRFRRSTVTTSGEGTVSQSILSDETVPTAEVGETIGVQLRRTLPDGSPDFSFDSLIHKQNFNIPGAGIYFLPLDWSIPAEDVNTTLALTFVSPMEGKNTIQLATDTSNPYPYGSLYVSDDLVEITHLENQDIYFRLFSTGYRSSGTLTMEYDVGQKVVWTSATLAAELPPDGSSIQCRFRFADSPAELYSAAWTEYYSGEEIYFHPQPRARLAQAEVLLQSSGESTPVFDSLELFYELPMVKSSLWILY